MKSRNLKAMYVSLHDKEPYLQRTGNLKFRY